MCATYLLNRLYVYKCARYILTEQLLQMHPQNAYLCIKITTIVNDNRYILYRKYLMICTRYVSKCILPMCEHARNGVPCMWLILLCYVLLLFFFFSLFYQNSMYAEYGKNVMPKKVHAANARILVFCRSAYVCTNCSKEYILHIVSITSFKVSLPYSHTLFSIHVTWLYITCERVIPHTQSENTDWLWD